MALFKSPQQVQQEQQQMQLQQGLQQDMRIANASPSQLANLAGAQAGRGLFNLIKEVVPQRIDPQVQRADLIQGVFEEAGKVGGGDQFKTLSFASQELARSGLVQEAAQLAQQAAQFAPVASPDEGPSMLGFGKIDPSKFTPESLAVAQQSGNFGDLVAIEENTLGKVNQAQFTPESFQAFMSTGDRAQLIPRQVASTNINLTETAEQLLNKGFAKNTVDAVVKADEASQLADGVMGQLDSIEGLVGAQETGGLTSTKVWATQIGRSLGIDMGDVSNEEAAEAAIGNLVLDLTSKLKGAISEKEIELITRAVPNLSQTKEGRMKMIGVLRKANQSTFDRADALNKFVDATGTSRGFQTVWNKRRRNSRITADDLRAPKAAPVAAAAPRADMPSDRAARLQALRAKRGR